MKWMWEHKKWIVLALLAVLLVGRVWVQGTKRKAQNAKTPMVSVEKRDVILSVTAAGRMEAERGAILNFPAAGKLGYINVKVGDSVKKWQALAGLDMGDLRAAETAAYYNYLAADANAKEIEDSVKGHDKDESYAQKNDRVAAQTARDKAYDSWLTAQRAVRNANLISPIDGIVTNVTVTVAGDTVGVADGITVVDPQSLYFATEVDETDVGKIAAGLSVEVVLDAFPDKKFEGTIQEIGFVAQLSDTGATVFKVKVSTQGDFRVGMNGDATMILKEVKNVLSLPVESVRDGKVTLESGKRVEVQTGLVGDSYVQITGGIGEGENVQRYRVD